MSLYIYICIYICIYIYIYIDIYTYRAHRRGILVSLQNVLSIERFLYRICP